MSVALTTAAGRSPVDEAGIRTGPAPACHECDRFTKPHLSTAVTDAESIRMKNLNKEGWVSERRSRAIARGRRTI